MFPLPKGKPEFSKLEEAILQKWKAEKTFEQSVESRPAENPYRFYDGPPFITGTPHYGSLLSSIIKDVVPRYQTMLGKRVERIWGWDCHGLPIEQKVQKKLGLESNKEIEESAGGIQHFIDECYNYTRETSADWNWYIDHIGRWVDMEHAYRTMDQDYMESVMWVFKQIWEKGYVYEGKRVSWFSWKLSTPISNFEIAMDDSYQDVQDPAVTIKFPLHDIKKGAGIIIQDEDGKLLLIKNKKDGLWRLPGGNIEPGESYHAGAARELLEETEITCELTPYCSTYIGYRGGFYEALSFRGVVPIGQKVVLEEDKFSDYEYFSLDALPLHSEIHRMEHDIIDFLTGVREPVIVPEYAPFSKGDGDSAGTEGDFEPENPQSSQSSDSSFEKGARVRKVNILAWTTTPWTLPMHMALAVNKDLQYVSVYHAEEIYILAASRVETVFKGKGEYQVLGTIPGEELVGLKYQPPFDYYIKNDKGIMNNEEGQKSFKIYHADFVTDTDGTGIAHEAPEFGDVDFQLAKQEGIHITAAIDEAGKYTAEIPDYQGQLYLDCIDPICERLKAEGTLFKKESITHRVPYCPRSNTPLMQRAQKSWFIDIQRIKGELMEQNESINWFPDHFKHGRFLKSLESAPDWCISRSRFWGTPMPIWQNTDGTERVVIGSREELYQANKPLGQITKVICVRHAESEANVAQFYDDIGEASLSQKGQQQAKELAEKLAGEGIDVILSSPFTRTRETAEPIAKKLGITVQTLDALREIDHGKFSNVTNSAESRASRNAFRADRDIKFGETGESQNDIQTRLKSVAELIQKEYIGKTVLVVTHGFSLQGLLEAFEKEKMPEKYTNASYGVTYLGPDGKEINLHRPKIDAIELVGKNGKRLQRIPEVLDVWMDSASMPYAQVHYPFENMEKMEASFPADFIAEYTGQIRAWFYVMHVLGVLVKGSPAFKNVAVTGVINGTDGRKMSKSYGNYPDPKATIEQYGADALRFYLMGGPIMRGEDMNFSETGIAESLKKVLIPLWNSYTFFSTYANIDGWKPDGTEIWFTRHAESEKNVEGRMSGGEDDSPLSPKGHEQVKTLLEQSKNMKPFDAIFSSPRKRTVDTISGLGEYVIDERFLEQDSGEYAGMLLTDVGKKLGTQDISKIRHAYRWNSVEPWDVFYKKIANTLDTVIAENTGKKILIAAHAGVFRACTQYFYNLQNEDVFYGSGIQNACLYRFAKTPKTHELDTWILSQLHNLVADTRKHMDNYDTQKACDGFVTFLDGLNNWYIRRNRRRFWRKEVDADKCSAYETLHEVLTTVCQLLAPICPFMTEYLYQNLTKGTVTPAEAGVHQGESGWIPAYAGMTENNSVHLTYFPSAHPLILGLAVNQKMRDLQNLTNLGLAIRGREKLRVRQPLRNASITLDLDESARATLAEELNVKEIHTISDIAEYVTITYSPDAKQIGATERKQWMKTIIADAKAGKGTLLDDGSLEILCPEAPGGTVLLSAEEFETIYTPKEGSTIAFAGNAGYVIGLDTTLDEALTFEGYARDLIRAIQDVRKEMGFQVMDRLALSLISESPLLAGILGAHKELIEAETLCTLAESVAAEEKVVELDEGFEVRIAVSAR